MGQMNGKKFEQLIKDSCEKQGLSYTRLKDAGWQGESTQRRFTVKNDCDCIIFDGSLLLFVEAKHRKDRMDFEGLKQLDLLLKKQASCDIPNIKHGFMFCVGGQFFYGNAEAVEFAKDNLGKKSFNPDDAPAFCWPIETFIPPRGRKERLDIRGLMRKLANNTQPQAGSD